jgi:hypothetical protein
VLIGGLPGKDPTWRQIFVPASKFCQAFHYVNSPADRSITRLSGRVRIETLYTQPRFTYNESITRLSGRLRIETSVRRHKTIEDLLHEHA